MWLPATPPSPCDVEYGKQGTMEGEDLNVVNDFLKDSIAKLFYLADKSCLSTKKEETKKTTKKRSRNVTFDVTLDNQKEETSTRETAEVFKVLGDDIVYDEVDEVENTDLPEWLKNPSVIPRSLYDVREIKCVEKLNPLIKANLEANGVTKFFPVQWTVIPYLLDSFACQWTRQSDICVSSPTGSGKTLMFVVPIIQALLDRVVCKLRAVVILPTKDLASQVYDTFQAYCEGTQLKVGLSVGLVSFLQEQQLFIGQKRSGPCSLIDILVCTPGRLVDHINETVGFSLSDLRFLVLDEADGVMQEKRSNWLNAVENCSELLHNSNILTVESTLSSRKLPPQRLLVSATLFMNTEEFNNLKLFQPKIFASVKTLKYLPKKFARVKDFVTIDKKYVGTYVAPVGLKENYVKCDAAMKPLIILHLIHNLGFNQMICFTNSVVVCHRLCLLLSHFGGITVAEYFADVELSKRLDILKQFAEGTVNVIVCSDMMARGLDPLNSECVVLYDLPKCIKGYIHRIGRTARCGCPGTAISLVLNDEVKSFTDMLKKSKHHVNQLCIRKSSLEPLEEKFVKTLEWVEAHKGKLKRSRKS